MHIYSKKQYEVEYLNGQVVENDTYNVEKQNRFKNTVKKFNKKEFSIDEF